MAGFQTQDKTKHRKLWIDHAIQLAMQSKWADAVTVNRTILENFPNDVETYNRLGRALREQGQFKEARAAYQRAVEIDPNNAIAQKNLQSLANVDVESGTANAQERVDPRLFIAETGKSGPATLSRVTDRAALAKMAVGDQVYLLPEGRVLHVQNARGERLGQVEPKVAQRLIDLINGGNKYAAALMSLDEGTARLIIHEAFQHPTQAGKVSFPTRGETGSLVRPYTKESLLKFSDFEDDDDDGDSDTEFAGEGESEGEETVESGDYEDDQQSE